ncbi:MAG: SGNH/GDSL hydrolase family protein [Planctomycetes bacterium]|nr:SGNH/GDSL hydrolase family protein [Planctomycetota bacterium]
MSEVEAPQPSSSEPTESALARPQRKRRKLPWQRKLLFASVLFFGPLVLLEGGLRLMGWPTDRIRTIKKLINFDKASFDEAIGVFRPKSTSKISWPPELAYTAKINSLGLRGPETTLEPAEGTFRILCLGDSTTFGFYVEENETLPHQLQTSLLAGGAGTLETVNGGCGGWSIASETQFFLERGARLKPQLVVLTFCGNDLADLKRERSNYEAQKAQLGQGASFLKDALYSTATYELLLRGKIAWKRARQKSAGREPHPLSSAAIEGPEGERLWGLYEGHLTRLRDELRKRKVALVVSYLPDAWRLQEGLEEVDSGRLGKLCARLKIPYVSGYPSFKGRPVSELYHAPIDAHQNAEGNRVLAADVARFLLDQGLVPKKK